MAPKKSNPSKNLIRHCGSSSPSLLFVPDSVRFRNEDAQKDIYENFIDRVIHSECQVILFDFPDVPLPGAFSSQGWESLCEKLIRCASVLL